MGGSCDRNPHGVYDRHPTTSIARRAPATTGGHAASWETTGGSGDKETSTESWCTGRGRQAWYHSVVCPGYHPDVCKNTRPPQYSGDASHGRRSRSATIVVYRRMHANECRM